MAFGRVPWSNAQVDAYNRYSKEIDRATYLPDRNAMLDRRHAFFVGATAFNERRGPEGAAQLRATLEKTNLKAAG